jgi:hypothetical protein
MMLFAGEMKRIAAAIIRALRASKNPGTVSTAHGMAIEDADAWLPFLADVPDDSGRVRYQAGREASEIAPSDANIINQS